MKKLFIKLGLLLLSLIILDIIAGAIFNLLHENAIGGSTKKNFYILKECDSDIIILRSSRASHHYVPDVISGLTGYSCYNCGEEGNGIVLGYARYQMIVKRYNPKVIVYEITPEYDFKYDEDNSKYLRYLKPYYGEEKVKEVVDLFSDRKTQFELLSNMYRNNSAIIANIADNIINRGDNNGYEPLWGQCVQNETNVRKSTPIVCDEKKIMLLNNMVTDAQKRGIKFFLVMSPSLSYVDPNTYYEAVKVSKQYNVPFINLLTYNEIINNPSYFQDDGHMNDKGARAFSDIFSRILIEAL